MKLDKKIILLILRLLFKIFIISVNAKKKKQIFYTILLKYKLDEKKTHFYTNAFFFIFF